MTKEYNDTFKRLLEEYNLPADLSFEVELPPDVQKIINDKIVLGELGITLKSFGKLRKAVERWENKSFIEDTENHFHVDSHIDPPDNKKAFMLGVHTLTLLAKKFQQNNTKDVRFFLSFSTPELGKQFARENNLHSEGDEYYISDRLSFHTRRPGEEVITIDESKNMFSAILIVDI